ncbi:MAG: hypothetical protein ACTHM1_12250 [Solirubrobacteraceae bacterium]
MRLLKFMGPMAVLLMAIGSPIASSAAAATNNPQWKLCEEVSPGSGKFTDSACSSAGVGNWEFITLKSGEERPVQAGGHGNQSLVVKSLGGGTANIVCKKVTLNSAAKVLGSNAPDAGSAEAILEYGSCEEEGNKSCEINKVSGGAATIATHALKATLVYSSLAGAEKENEAETETLLEPKEGATFASLELGPTCKAAGFYSFEGHALAENLKASEHLAIHEVAFKEGAKYWSNEAGKSVEHSVAALKSSTGAELKIKGTVEIWIEIGPISIYAKFSF